MIYSAVFKAKAREALRNHWQTALLIALIVNLPSLLVQGIAAFTNNDLIDRLELLAVDATVSTAALNAFPDAVRALVAEPGILLMTGLSLLAWLVTPVLSLGMNHWTLDRLRGAEEPVSTVFSRLHIFFRSIGLRLYIVLRVLLWMLPGIAVTVAAILPLYNATAADAASVLNGSIWMIWLGMILMTVLGVMAYLYYALADFILADEPGERITSCARRSKELMKGRRSALLSLVLSFLLWYLLVIFVTSFIAGIAGAVFALVLQMLGSLLISVYMLAAEGVFYEALRKAPVQQIPADTPDASDRPGE